MRAFLMNNRDELLARCAAKVSARPARGATVSQLANGIPMFLGQLIRTLQAEEDGALAESRSISGAAGGDASALSEIGVSAAAHGKQLLTLEYSVDQVVHDYGELCQAITDLAVERDAPFSTGEFRTLNRCLDNAIADAVVEFGAHRDAGVARRNLADENERLGALVHELRNVVHTASLAFDALKAGGLAIGGSTGSLLERSLGELSGMLCDALGEVRSIAAKTPPASVIPVDAFLAAATASAFLSAKSKGCSLVTVPADPLLHICGNRERLVAALFNLLQNAFKFTHVGTDVTLRARSDGGQVLIEVEDRCGGLPAGAAESMFEPFAQSGVDRSGVGLGLSIARKSVEADGGVLSVRNLPGQGCVFVMSLPKLMKPA